MNNFNNLEKAKELLKNSGITCVFCSDTEIVTSQKRGVAPLLTWLDSGKNLKAYSVADKVVGNGAAFLYVLLEVKELYANVISKSALETLKKYQISVNYNIITEAIRNRDNTGLCPIETAVADIAAPDKALIAIRNKLEEMHKFEYIKFFWEFIDNETPVVIFYEIDLVNKIFNRFATRVIEVFPDRTVSTIINKDYDYVTEDSLPTVEEINQGICGEEFHAELISQKEFDSIWQSKKYLGKIAFS